MDPFFKGLKKVWLSSLGKYSWAHTCLWPFFIFRLKTWIRYLFGIKSHYLNEFLFCGKGLTCIWTTVKLKKRHSSKDLFSIFFFIMVILIYIFSSCSFTFEFYITIILHVSLWSVACWLVCLSKYIIGNNSSFLS